MTRCARSHAMNARAARRLPVALALAGAILAMTDTLAAQSTQAAATTNSPPSSAPATLPWQQVATWLDGEVARFTQSLGAAHAALLQRAKAANDEAAVERLQPLPPQPRARGYGLLPPIRPDLPVRTTPIGSRRYALEDVSVMYARDLRDAALLAVRAADASTPHGAHVDEYLRLKGRHDLLQKQIAYHRYWQDAVPRYEAYFQGRNRIAVKVDRMLLLRTDPQKAAEAAALHDEIQAELAPFVPTKGLRIEAGDAGALRLQVEVLTDVADDTFLARMRDAIVREWSECEASRARNLRIDVAWRRMTADDWRAPPPPAGVVVDQKEHLARFPEGALVLTTGVASTVAMMGHAILLGTDPIRPRELAHEFGHLLGFQDAYLRTYEGDVKAPFGLRLVEWDGLLDDLMGDSVCGVVDDGMVKRLLAAYGPDK